MKQPVERRLAVILAADVAILGWWARTKKTRSDHRGRIARTTGDGLLIEFASVFGAVRCGVGIQRAMAEQSAAMSATAAHRILHRTVASVCAMTISSPVQLLTGRLRRRGGAHALVGRRV